jgi:tetratricopeptide (TPR) repeat protein
MINRNILVALAGLTILTVVGLGYFNFMTHESVPGENRYRLANQYLSEGKTEDALAVFDEALSENPSYPSAFVGKAIALMELGRFDESRENFDRAIQLNEKLAAAYANRGILNDRAGKYREAVRDYRTAVELDPQGRLYRG